MPSFVGELAVLADQFRLEKREVRIAQTTATAVQYRKIAAF